MSMNPEYAKGRPEPPPVASAAPAICNERVPVGASTYLCVLPEGHAGGHDHDPARLLEVPVDTGAPAGDPAPADAVDVVRLDTGDAETDGRPQED